MSIRVQPREPKGVTAILHGGGLRVPCSVIPDGESRDHVYGTVLKYRIVAEVDWRQHQIERIEIQWWPANVALCLDLGHEITEMELMAYAARVKWVDLSNTNN